MLNETYQTTKDTDVIKSLWNTAWCRNQTIF